MKDYKSDCLWLFPPVEMSLGADEIHVWRASLNQMPFVVQKLETVLAPDELSRANRFYFQKDRRRFIVGRGVLRFILGRYLSIKPGELRFIRNSYGKPALLPELNSPELKFNLSHSYELALYAVTCHREIGVDLEYVRADFAWEQVATRFFSVQEQAKLQNLPEHSRHKGFFTFWTRKEAHLKALGEGLGRLDTTLLPTEPTAYWSLRDLDPASDYTAALVVEGYDWQLVCWQWTE